MNDPTNDPGTQDVVIGFVLLVIFAVVQLLRYFLGDA